MVFGRLSSHYATPQFAYAIPVKILLFHLGLPRNIPRPVVVILLLEMTLRSLHSCLLLPALWLAASTHGAEVSFRNDVQAVIAKAGCNLGTCHGNTTGKGGFKMSLRGSDLSYDYAALAEDVAGRRVNFIEPENSLLLQKATQSIAHEGGKRFAEGSWEYNTLRDWIAQGAKPLVKDEPRLAKLEVTPKNQLLVEPESTAQIKVMATFTDGRQADVTPYAVYEPAQVGLVNVSREGRVDRLQAGEATIIVRYLDKQQPVQLAFVPARPDFEWQPTRQNNFIDRHVFAKLKSLRMTPSALCTDAVYVRRAYLDLCGIPPTTAEARAFIADKSPAKPEQLVEKLLTSSSFADFWALKWADTLRVESRTMDVKGMTAFHQWIRNAVASNMPVDRFAHDILAAQGSTYTVPQTNFYRAMREPNARAEGIAQVFLGTRLKCAQCHNHPFDKWTQDDYFQWSAVFSRVDYEILDNKGVDKNDKHQFNGEQIVKLTKETKLTNPRTGEASKAKLLGAAVIEDATLGNMTELDAAADWVTNPKNALFAQAQVNRIWFHMMGRGLVDPVDDFRSTNPASHPALLEELAATFVESGYDLRRILRLIMASRTYQLSSEPNENNADDAVNYSHNLVRRLTSEQLLDSLHQFAGLRPSFASLGPEITRASQRPGPINRKRRDKGTESDMFLANFGQPPRLLACDCERSNETTMGQAFTLISGPQVSQLLKDEGNILGKLLKRSATEEEMVDALFWSALTRSATEEERSKIAGMLRTAPDKRAMLEDIAWSLVNAKEFVLRN